MTRKDILKYATEQGVPPDTIDKDWVLGIFLKVLFSKKWAIENLVFKGGTCLKKCYFPNYRFSEDIDLTVIHQGFIFTKDQLQEVCDEMSSVYDIANRVMKLEVVRHNNINVGWDAEICYWGANHNPNDTPVFRNVCHTKIILEIRDFEKIVFPIQNRLLSDSYSKADEVQIFIPCYGIEEILSEKLRAILQRNRGEARDFFDIWYISHYYPLDINWTSVTQAFIEKCNYKSVAFHHPDDFFEEKRLQQVAITWEKRLAHQINLDVSREKVIDDLKEFLPNLFVA